MCVLFLTAMASLPWDFECQHTVLRKKKVAQAPLPGAPPPSNLERNLALLRERSTWWFGNAFPIRISNTPYHLAPEAPLPGVPPSPDDPLPTPRTTRKQKNRRQKLRKQFSKKHKELKQMVTGIIQEEPHIADAVVVL